MDKYKDYREYRESWLKTKIQYEDKLTIDNAIDLFLNHIITWYNETNELSMITDKETFESKFREFLYRVYHMNIIARNDLAFDETYQYFDLKYSDDIQTIYERCRDISVAYNLSLFDNKSYDHLTEFLYEFFEIMEEIEEPDEEDKDYIGYSIYEKERL